MERKRISELEWHRGPLGAAKLYVNKMFHSAGDLWKNLQRGGRHEDERLMSASRHMLGHDLQQRREEPGNWCAVPDIAWLIRE